MEVEIFCGFCDQKPKHSILSVIKIYWIKIIFCVTFKNIYCKLEKEIFFYKLNKILTICKNKDIKLNYIHTIYSKLVISNLKLKYILLNI